MHQLLFQQHLQVLQKVNKGPDTGLVCAIGELEIQAIHATPS